MSQEPPIPPDRIASLLQRLADAPEAAHPRLVEEAADGDPGLARRIQAWLDARADRGDDAMEARTIVPEEDTSPEAERPDLAATLDGDSASPTDGRPSGPPSEMETVFESGGVEDATLAAPATPDEIRSDPEPARGPAGRPDDRGRFGSHPRMIEGFAVEKLLGAGGMGSVYLCRQASPEREVAVKLMLPGIANARAVQRFEFEIETLAKLSHPNVARLFEAGLHDTPKGPTPYVAMEMVRGARTITEFADETDLDFDARIELFIRGCRGVAFGHGRGVIHRDLKPPNLLVDEKGEPKVIDFGVALAADDDEGRQELVGTLQYMAPEQATRGEVGTATDVYALGLILFEMLAGEPPYMVPGDSLRAALDAIANVEVPRLASRVPKVDRDVDAILAKALSLDPDARYATAGDLAADLQRYLDDEPTIARAPSFGESLMRLVRKHRIEAGFAVAAVIALVVGIIGTTIYAYQAETARVKATQAEGETRLALERVEDEQVRMERSLALFLSVLGNLEPAEIGRTMIASMIDGIDRELERRGSDEDAAIDAIVRQRELSELFGPTDVAIDIVERHLEAPTVRLFPLIAEDRRTRANLSEFLGEMLASIGRLEDSEGHYRDAIDDWSSVETRSGENLRRARGNRAGTLLLLGRVGEAIDEFEMLVSDGRDASGSLDLLGLQHLNALAAALAGNGEVEAAYRRFEETLEGYLALADGGEVDPESIASDLAQVRSNIGSSLLTLGELDEAEPRLIEARSALVALEGMDEGIVQVELNLGRLYFQRGRIEDAGIAFARAVDEATDRFGRSYLLTAEAMSELGQFRFQTADYAAAIPLLETARETMVEQLGPEASPTLISGLFLTLSYAASGDLETGFRLLEMVDGDFVAAGGAADPNRLTLLYFYTQFSNAAGGIAGERGATIALERLHDACIESGQVAGAENRSRMCTDAETLLVRFYEAMIEAEPEGDWTTRRDVRFGS